jgi:hypothetical protein
MVRKRLELFEETKKDHRGQSLREITFHDWSVIYLSYDWFTENIMDEDHEDFATAESDYAVIEWSGKTEDLQNAAQRMEGNTMYVTETIWWQARPKHCDFYIETTPISNTTFPLEIGKFKGGEPSEIPELAGS